MATFKKSRSKFGWTAGNQTDAIQALLQARTRDILGAANIADMTDNSTGTNTGSLVAIPGGFAAFTHVSGSDLSQKTGFDGALVKADNAIAVVATRLSDMLAAIGATQITLNATGVVAVAGTIAACDKTSTGVDGSSATAADRVTANDRVTKIKNNFATLVRAYNNVAVGCGFTTLADASGGSASTSLTLVDIAATGSGVSNTGDALKKAYGDDFLTKTVDDISKLAAAMATLDTLADTKMVTLLVP